MRDLTSADKDDIQRQVDRLLASSRFKNSRRYTDLLRYVVQQTMDGHGDSLKERTLGIEVFGREPGFDTAGDSIVRVAVAEVRKRIAQYYQEEGHEDELRVDLPPGSYVAHFRRVQEPMAMPASEVPASAPADPAPESPAANPGPRKWPLLVFGTVLAAAFALALGFLGLLKERRDLLRPLWTGSQDVIVCIGAPLLAHIQPGVADLRAEKALGQPTANNIVLPFSDAMTLSGLEVLLSRHRRPLRVRLAQNTTLNDLRTGPVILVGALDNPWTMRLTEGMRFHFEGTDADKGAIVDSKAKPIRSWSVDFHVPYSERAEDYAIVAITRDGTLDQPLVVAAGIGPNGTMAASEFLMDQGDLDALRKNAPPNWGGKNVEVVLATQVIQGNSGPPRIVTVEYW